MENDNKKSQLSALSIALQFGYTIAVPIVILALVGRLLDKRFDTSPWMLIGGILLSIAISSVALVMKFTKILAQINEESAKKSPKDSSSAEQK